MEMLDVPKVVSASCVLHICETHKGMFDEEWLKGVESETSEHGSAMTGAAQPLTAAVAIRDAFTTHFAT
jgi:hypothetical protein